MDAQTVNLICNVIAGVLGITAIALSVTFYIAGRTIEVKVSNALSEIKAQTEALQKLSGKQIDKLMKHALETPRVDTSVETTRQLFKVLQLFPNVLTPPSQQQPKDTDEEVVILLYIALYFYLAQTNYWAQGYLPKASDFDETDDFHKLTQRIIDMSAADFKFVEDALNNTKPELIQNNRITHLYNETDKSWKYFVMSTSETFVSKEQSSA